MANSGLKEFLLYRKDCWLDASALHENPRELNKPCVLIFLHIALGIMIDRAVGISIPVSIILCSILFATYWLFRLIKVERASWVGSHLLLSLSVFAGAASHHIQWNLFAANDIGLYVSSTPKPIKVRGTVTRASISIPARPYNPMERKEVGDRVRFQLSVSACRHGLEWKKG